MCGARPSEPLDFMVPSIKVKSFGKSKRRRRGNFQDKGSNNEVTNG